MTEEIDTLLEEIESTEKHLAELRKEYRERKTAGYVRHCKPVQRQKSCFVRR